MNSTNSLSNMDLKQIVEMNEKAKQLVQLMKQGIVQFIFKKKSTGKIRKAHGTLKKDLIPKESQRKSGRPRKRPDDLVIYFDTDKQEIRSFKDYLLQKIFKPNFSDISKSQKNVNSKQNKKISNNNSTNDEKQDNKDNGKQK